MNKRKIGIAGASIAAIIAAVGVMAVVKNGAPSSADTGGQQTKEIDQSLLYSGLELTAPFDLAAYRAAGVPVIIDFGADSCIPCKEMAPVLAELHRELQGKAIIRFVDVWKYRNLADGIPLQVIPTQIFFDAEGKPFAPSESVPLELTMYSTRETNEHVFTTHAGGLSKDQLLAVLREMGMSE